MARPRLVSVLTPSYQQIKFLPACLESVRMQSYKHLEHIVQDGGSTDGSVLLLTAAAKEDPRLSFVSESDGGQADAINRCFQRASGDIIAWINSDDGFYGRGALASVVDAFERHPEVDVIFGDSLYVSECGLVLRHIRSIWPASGRRLYDECPLNQPAVFLRREALGDRFLDDGLQFAMDYELWIRLATAGKQFRRLATVLAFDRDHPNRKVRTLRDVRAREWKVLEDRYGVRLDIRDTLFRRWVRRLAGLPRFLALRSAKANPSLILASRPERVLRQLMWSHRRQS